MSSHVASHANIIKCLESFWSSGKVRTSVGSALEGCFGLNHGRDEGASRLQLVRFVNIRDHAHTHDWPTDHDQSSRLQCQHTKHSRRRKIKEYNKLAFSIALSEINN